MKYYEGRWKLSMVFNAFHVFLMRAEHVPRMADLTMDSAKAELLSCKRQPTLLFATV